MTPVPIPRAGPSLAAPPAAMATAPPPPPLNYFPSHHVMTTAPAHVTEAVLSIKLDPLQSPPAIGRRPAFRKRTL